MARCAPGARGGVVAIAVAWWCSVGAGARRAVARAASGAALEQTSAAQRSRWPLSRPLLPFVPLLAPPEAPPHPWRRRAPVAARRRDRVIAGWTPKTAISEVFGSGATWAPPWAPRKHPGGLQNMALADRDGSFTAQLTVAVPEEWQLSRLRVLHHGFSGLIITGRSARVPGEIVIKIRDRDYPGRTHEVEALRSLRSSGNVIPYLGDVQIGRWSFLMTARAQCRLGQWMHFLRANEGDVSLELSLVWLVDILRGVSDMDAKGVIHGGLSEDEILVLDNRPVIAGFSSTGLESNGGDAVFSSGLSEFRTPPETRRGFPTGPSNHIWHVGAMFAEMRLGYLPMKVAAERSDPGLPQQRFWSPELEDNVQEFIRDEFSIAEDEGFRTLDQVSRVLLQGMLEVSVEERWDSATALDRALVACRASGVPVPPERPPPSIALRNSGWG